MTIPRRASLALLALALAVFAALAPAPAAHAATLSGHLLEQGSSHPIEGAFVRLVETGRETHTDAMGRFSFASLAPGRYTLSAHHLAFADAERTIEVHASGDAPLEIVLRPALYRTDEVIVRSTRSSSLARSGALPAEALGVERIEARPSLGVADVLADVPGLALVRDGGWATAIAIRGMSRSNIVTLVDDVRLETANDIGGVMSLVSVADLERVEVMKSPGSVLFGSGAFGGAVQMVTKRARFADRTRVGAEWTERVTGVDEGASHHLAAEIAGPRQSLRLAGGFHNTGDTDTPAGALPHSQVHDWNASLSFAERTFGQQSLLVSYQRVQAENTGIPGGAPFATSAIARFPLTRRELASLEYTIPNPSRRVALVTVRASHQEIVRRVELIQSPTVTVTPHAVHGATSAQVEARLLPGGAHVLTAGLDAWRRNLDSRRERWQWALKRVTGERPVPRSQFASGGAYAQDEWAFAGARARLVTGARYDAGRTHNDRTLNPVYVINNGVRNDAPAGQVVLWKARTTWDASWDASSGLNVAVARALSLSALVATAYRSPSLEERFQFLDLGGTNLHVGNSDLRPERSVSLNAGAHLHGHGGAVRVDVYLNRFTDLVSEVPGTFEGRAAYVKANIGRARIEGGELSGEQALGGFVALKGSFAWARGRDTAHDVWLTQVPPFSGTGGVTLRAGGAGTLDVGCVAMRAQVAPGPGETETPGWTVWNANVATAPLAFAGHALRVRAGVDNAFDRAYRQHLSTLRGTIRLEPGRNVWASATVTL